MDGENQKEYDEGQKNDQNGEEAKADADVVKNEQEVGDVKLDDQATELVVDTAVDKRLQPLFEQKEYFQNELEEFKTKTSKIEVKVDQE